MENFEGNIESSDTTTEEKQTGGKGIFHDYFNPPPPLTAEEIAKNEAIENKEIEKRFWQGLEQHIIEVDDRPNYVYTERKGQLKDAETCVVFSDVKTEDVEKGNPNAKVFILARPTSVENNKKPQNNLGKMEEEEMKYLNVIQKDIVRDIDSKGDPNKINVSEMGKHVTIRGEEYFFFYVPEGSGVGTDGLKGIKRSVGMKNR